MHTHARLKTETKQDRHFSRHLCIKKVYEATVGLFSYYACHIYHYSLIEQAFALQGSYEL